MNGWKRTATRETCVWISITSDTSTAHGSWVRRQGSASRVARALPHQAKIAETKLLSRVVAASLLKVRASLYSGLARVENGNTQSSRVSPSIERRQV